MNENDVAISLEIRFGPTVTSKDTIYSTLSSVPSPCLQTFWGDAAKMELKPMTQNDHSSTMKHCKDNDKTFYIHTPFSCNLAHSEKEWIRRKSRELLKHQMNILQDLPAAPVLHVGRVGPLSNVIKGLNDLNIQPSRTRIPSLLIENAAGQGTELGASWNDLRLLFEGLDQVKGRVSLCLDTQHLFASGMCKFSDHEDVVKLFDNADALGGVTMFHLNDSKTEYGSRVDRHFALGRGFIWGQGINTESFNSLIEIGRERDIDFISETDNFESDTEVIASYK